LFQTEQTLNKWVNIKDGAVLMDRKLALLKINRIIDMSLIQLLSSFITDEIIAAGVPVVIPNIKRLKSAFSENLCPVTP
jgi:hypothetical protein